MSASAIVMMIVAITIVWGGLLAAVLFLRARPQVTDGEWAVDPDGPDGPTGNDHRPTDGPLHRDT